MKALPQNNCIAAVPLYFYANFSAHFAHEPCCEECNSIIITPVEKAMWVDKTMTGIALTNSNLTIYFCNRLKLQHKA